MGSDDLPSYLFGSSLLSCFLLYPAQLPSYLFGSSPLADAGVRTEILPSYLFGSSLVQKSLACVSVSSKLHIR